jgi:16S rRNA (uracil1498-N3)-methyltransferase
MIGGPGKRLKGNLLRDGRLPPRRGSNSRILGPAVAAHRIFLQDIHPGPLTVEGDEAHHAARVKRLAEGDAIELLDGRGNVGEARLAGISKERGQWRLALDVRSIRREQPVRPRVEVCSPAPKGPRLTEMIDGLSQAGAAAWSPLETERTIVEPGAAKLQRLERTAWETAKQCGRAWVLEIGGPMSLRTALDPSMQLVLADATGDAYRPAGAKSVRLLVGPEGGWSRGELDAARDSGAAIARFGPHTMRIETAAVVAAAIILEAERRGL